MADHFDRHDQDTWWAALMRREPAGVDRSRWLDWRAWADNRPADDELLPEPRQCPEFDGAAV